MTDMSKLKLVFGLVVSLSAIAFSAVPALAEFSSTATSGKAKGEGTVEAGGLTVTCTSAEAQWKIPKSPSPKEISQTKASKCLGKTAEFKEIEGTTNACEGEYTSKSKGVTKEAEVLGTILRLARLLLKFWVLRVKSRQNQKVIKNLKRLKLLTKAPTSRY